MYSQTSRKRITEDIKAIDSCLAEHSPVKARNLLTIMTRTYDGIIMSLNTAMLPTESPIYGHNFDELKNYDENVFSNLTIIRNKLQLFDLQYYRELDQSLADMDFRNLSSGEMIDAIQSDPDLKDKDKAETLKMAKLLLDISEEDSLDREAKWQKAKPAIIYLAGVSAKTGYLFLELLRRLA